MTPNRVNRAHWPTRKIGKTNYALHVSSTWKKLREMAPNGARSLFPLLIQTSPTFWATRILIFDNLFCFPFLDPRFPESQTFGFPDSWVSRFPDSWILESGSWLWLAAARGAPVAGSRLFVNGTPGPQNSGDPRN